MGKINKLFLAVIFSAVLVSFLITPFASAKSNLPAPFYRTPNLTLGYKTSKFFNGKDYQRDVQYSYYRKMFLGADNFQWKCGVSKDVAKASFDKAVKDGNLVITQSESSGVGVFGDKASTYGSYYTINFYWSEKKLPIQKLIWDKNRGYQFENPAAFNRLSMSLVPSNNAYVYCNSSKILRNDYDVIISHRRDEPSIQQQISVFVSDVKYELGRGLEGVDPNDLFIPQSFEEKLQPDFMWYVDEKLKFSIVYMNNVKEFKNQNPPLEGYLKWHVVLRESDNQRSDGNIIDDSKTDLLMSYERMLPARAIYKLEVSLDSSDLPLVLDPRPDFSWVKKRTFIIDADGKLHTGDTFSGNCDDNGVCVAAPITCDDMSNVLQRSSCRMNEKFGSGVLNPSLLSLRRLVSSFVVPDNPSCGISISAPPDRRFQAFNPSTVVADACNRTKSFRQSFPLASVIVNFSAAMFWLWLIVRIFNKLTSHKDDDMIGDV